MLKYIKELFHPELKCKRVGHEHVLHERVIYVRPWTLEEAYKKQEDRSCFVSNATISSVLVEMPICRRCGDVKGNLKDWKILKYSHINKFSATKELWEHLEKYGYVFEENVVYGNLVYVNDD